MLNKNNDFLWVAGNRFNLEGFGFEDRHGCGLSPVDDGFEGSFLLRVMNISSIFSPNVPFGIVEEDKVSQGINAIGAPSIMKRV